MYWNIKSSLICFYISRFQSKINPKNHGYRVTQALWFFQHKTVSHLRKEIFTHIHFRFTYENNCLSLQTHITIKTKHLESYAHIAHIYILCHNSVMPIPIWAYIIERGTPTYRYSLPCLSMIPTNTKSVLKSTTLGLGLCFPSVKVEVFFQLLPI